MKWLRKHWIITLILAAIVLLFIIPVLADDPLRQNISQANLPLGSEGHFLGTDRYGRDVASRMLYGIRTELTVALCSTAIAALIGISLGLLGGYFRRWVELVTMRGVDILLSFPAIVLAVLVVATYGAGTTTLIAVLSLMFVPAFARITFGQTLVLREMEFVDASKTFGSSALRTMTTVILPNAAPALIVQTSLVLAEAIVIGSSVSYLGLGVVPPTPSLGVMLADGQNHMATAPIGVIVPAAAVIMLTLAFMVLANLLGNAMDLKRRPSRSTT